VAWRGRGQVDYGRSDYCLLVGFLAVMWPLEALLDLLGASWSPLDASEDLLEPLGSLLGGSWKVWKVLRKLFRGSWRLLGGSWVVLERAWGVLEGPWEHLGSILAPQELPDVPQMGQNTSPKRMAC